MLERMQRHNKAWLGGTGGGVGAAVAQLVILWGWVPPEGEAALSIVLAAVLSALAAGFGPANK